MFNIFSKKKSNKQSEADYMKTRPPKFGHSTYSDYIKSVDWAEKKIKFKSSDYCHKTDGFPSCSVCGSKKSPQVHHLTYKNLCNENFEDLLLLCKRCHTVTHELLNVKIDKKINLANAHTYVKRFLRSKKLKLRYVSLKFDS